MKLFPKPLARLASFTLIELLTVIAIIAILAALVLAAGSAVMNQAARKRAASEIQAMSTGLESYKTDNGVYPQLPAALTSFTTNSYAGNDGSQSAGLYQQSAQFLYEALSSQTNYLDVPVAGTRSYMTFRPNQVGNINTAAGTGYSAATSTYVKDPWNYSYGYSNMTNNSSATPYNGAGFFDLWSTGGLLTANVNTTNWISNFQ